MTRTPSATLPLATRWAAVAAAVLCCAAGVEAQAGGFVTRTAVASFIAFEEQAKIVRCNPAYFPAPFCPKGTTMHDTWNSTSSGGSIKLTTEEFALTCETYAYCVPTAAAP